jgi:uroporphyrinogen-III decarboxylase
MNTAVQTSETNVRYDQREKRLSDAVALRRPDRVPIVFNSLFWHTRQAGLSFRDAMYDYDGLSAATRKALEELQPDAYVLPHPIMALGPTMEIMAYRQLKWPGHDGVSADVPFQYLDKEYMKADEYADYLFDPTGFMLHKYLPRIAGVFEPFAKLPNFPSLYYTRIIHSTRAFSNPGLIQSFQNLAKAGEEMGRMLGKTLQFIDDMAALGYPLAESATALAPYDLFADYFRGSKGIMLDMFKQKDILREALDKAARLIPLQAIPAAQHSRSKGVFIPLHWPGDGLMSPDQFKTFYWPPLRKVVMALIENGLTPVLFWEGNCTSRLEHITDVPAGKCVYFFERTDIFKAKEVLGKLACLRGNVPATLMTAGTPEEIRAYCRKLIEVVGKDGGFIMDGGTGIPDEAKDENVRAMFDATREYGGYS